MTAFFAALRTVVPAAKVAIALAAIGLGEMGGALLLLAPARTRTAALGARLSVLRSEVARARTAVADLAHDTRARADLERRLEAIQRKLPVEREISPLYRRTYEAASSTGLAVSLFQPRDPRPLDYYVEIPISITAEGMYHQLGKFLERLAGFARVVRVSTLKLSRVERAGALLRAEMTIVTYVYRPAATSVPKSGAAVTPLGPASAAPTPPALPVIRAGQPGRTMAPSAVAAEEPRPTGTLHRESRSAATPVFLARGRRDPFESPSPPGVLGPGAAAHHRSTIASATLTGIVRGPRGSVALVEMADGIGHVLRPGDEIDEARLLRIERYAVVFEIPARPGLTSRQIVLALGRAQ